MQGHPNKLELKSESKSEEAGTRTVTQIGENFVKTNSKFSITD